MQVPLNNPELQAKIEQWVADTGRPAEELVEDALAGYFERASQVREILDSRYDDIKSGTVQMLDGKKRLRCLERKATLGAKVARERFSASPEGLHRHPGPVGVYC